MAFEAFMALFWESDWFPRNIQKHFVKNRKSLYYHLMSIFCAISAMKMNNSHVHPENQCVSSQTLEKRSAIKVP
jgi:hypothetical protein